MSIPVTDSQGTKAYLVATGTTVTTAADIVTAIAAGKQIGCIQDIGDISTTRSVQSYSCLSSDEVAKSLGSLTLPSVDMSLLFDADDATGQADMRTMYANNERRIMIIELNDQITPTTGNPTYITFEVALSKFGNSISKDNAVMQMATIEICSAPVFVYAT